MRRDADAVALLSTDALCVARWTNGGWTFVTIDVVPRAGVDVLTARLPTSPAVFPFVSETKENTVDYLTGRLADARI